MLAWMNRGDAAADPRRGPHRVLEPQPPGGVAKGDTSGDRQWVREAFYDCDGDTLLFVVEQEGKGACHTGDAPCFYRAFGAAAW